MTIVYLLYFTNKNQNKHLADSFLIAPFPDHYLIVPYHGKEYTPIRLDRLVFYISKCGCLLSKFNTCIIFTFLKKNVNFTKKIGSFGQFFVLAIQTSNTDCFMPRKDQQHAYQQCESYFLV